jgi:hypothetical protein
MATIASTQRARTRVTSWAGIRSPVWLAIVFSRLVVLAGGALGSLFMSWAPGWHAFDPRDLSVKLGSVGNVLAATTDRWDAIHYLDIAQHGYTSALNTAYFPLYPLLIHVVGWFTGSDVLAGGAISVVSFVTALVLMHRLVREELDERAADASVLLLAFAPLSFFFTAVYTESLFLVLSVATFYLARHDRLTLAGLAAVAATLSHIEGVLLVVPLAFAYWERRGRPRRIRDLVSVQAAPLLLPAFAIAGLMAYLHGRGFGWMAPISNETNPAWHHQFTGPVIALIRAISTGMSGIFQTVRGFPTLGRSTDAFNLPFQSVVYLVVLVICLAALVETWRRLPTVYTVYTTLFLIVITSSPIEGDPLASFDRYLLPLFPLWIAAAAWLRERNRLRVVVEFCGVLLFFYSFEVGRWAFVG